MHSDQALRAQYLYRSRYRGTKEMDLLVGAFAERVLPTLAGAALLDYGRFLAMDDYQLYDLLCGRSQPPVGLDNPVLEIWCRFRLPAQAG